MQNLDEIKRNVRDMQCSISNINKQLEELEQQKDWPQEGDQYYNIYNNGGVCKHKYNDSIEHKDIINFLGIFRTQEEAEKARDYYKAIRIIDEHCYNWIGYKNIIQYFFNELNIDLIRKKLKKHNIDIDDII